MRSDSLTHEQIIKAAIDLLDAEGLPGLNMRALGKRLDAAASAVYWHFGSKDDLVMRAGDRVWHEIALPDLGATDWRTAATAMATDLNATLTLHPWLVQAFGSYVVYGPGKARYDDHSIAIYEAAGFTGARADQAATAVLTYVLGNALGPAAAASLPRKVSRAGGDAEAHMGERIAQAREIATRFPRLRARFNTAAARYAAAPEHSFEFGLGAIFDGLEAHLMRSTRVSRHINAPRALVYRTLLDARALPRWKVPEGMTCHVHEFDAREGGAIRVSLTYDAPTGTGKTSAQTDTYHGHFDTLVPDEQIVEVDEFETADPALRGEMTITITLVEADSGTDLVGVHEGLPPGVSIADNEMGWQMALAKLAALVEESEKRPGLAISEGRIDS